jgi:16S rRNA G966 N2-methylase RsmD
MSMKLDVSLTEQQKAAMAIIPAASWFTPFVWNNATSPKHPVSRLDENNDYKQRLVQDWIERNVKGKRVLDLFAANGAFSIMAWRAGAREVVGVEFDEGRVECARFVASTLNAGRRIEFLTGDVYRLREYFNEPFDVTLCLGGLYHIADPPYVLRQIRAVTTERLIMQTSNLWPFPWNQARFRVRRDRGKEGLTSIRREGAWRATPTTVRQWLLHGHFRVLEERLPPLMKRHRFPWFAALCEPN